MTLMIPGLVLAAGAATRMGRPKALLPTGLAGETFLSRVVTTLQAAGVDDVVIVTAPGADDVRRALAALPVLARVVENPHPEHGQLSSMLAGLNFVDHPGVNAVLVTLVDAPFVAHETVRTLLEAYRRTHAPIVRPARGGRHGHPVIFDRRVFQELRHADPAQGAKAVVRAHAGEVLDVEVVDDGAFQDIDTPEDYERATGLRLPSGA
jgi:CTP:molybdopterin cytidylyltransferase MocA